MAISQPGFVPEENPAIDSVYRVIHPKPGNRPAENSDIASVYDIIHPQIIKATQTNSWGRAIYVPKSDYDLPQIAKCH